MERAHELGLGALGLCDVDGLYGAVRGWKRARELGVRFLVGAELRLELDPAKKTEQEGLAELPSVALLVQNARGYENLCRLLTKSHADRPKGESGCHPDWLGAHAEGLVAVVPAPRLAGASATSKDTLTRTLELLTEAFPQRAYVATYRHLDGLDPARARWARAAAQRYGLPIVASSRPRYHLPSRGPLADVMHCVRRGLTLDQAGTELAPNHEAYLRSEADMRRLFADHPEWVDRTAEAAESLRFDLGELEYHFPCELTPGQSADDRLAELTWEGAARRYPEGCGAELEAQLHKELRLIAKIGVAPYFLSTRDIVEIARRRRILCQGRGSAANSAVCYVLGITAVDPKRSKLLFERFLSEERAEPPDIDIDFEHERREEVIQEIYERYGRERAAMVCEVISYRGKSALREVGKVFGLSLEQVDRLSGTLTHWDASEVAEKRLTEAGFDARDARVRQVVALAGQLQGFPRHLSIHVGGFVLSSRPLYEVAPIEPARMEGRTVIPWDKDDIDALGFFKVDVLGLGMLTAIRKALTLIHADGGLRLSSSTSASASGASTSGFPDPRASASGSPDPSAPAGQQSPSLHASHPEDDPLEVITRIPAEDPAVYDMMGRADTVGVFQIESRAQMAMLPRLRPRSYYDLVIEVALVRPGPIQGGMVHPYLRRRNGEEDITFPHEDLVPVLERTKGVPLFQEQVMQIAILGAGYTGGEADQLRRDMAAWKKTGKLMRHRDRLLRGFARKGIEQSFGAALFEQIKGFGDYGFPESHASSFALLVYVSAWQKAHYPAHFACAVINSQPMGFYQPSTLVRDAQRHGVEVRDVSVLRSNWDCTLEPPGDECRIESTAVGARRALRLGLRLVKGLGETAARRIETARAELSGTFESLSELTRRAALKKDEVEALAEAGALEELVPGRRQALWQARAPRAPGLFYESSLNEPDAALPELRSAEQLLLDYGRKGLSVSDHPMRYLRKRLSKQGVVRAADLAYLPKGAPVRVAGLVLSRQQPATASGVVFFTIEDETGFSNLIVYSSVYEQFHHVARHASLLVAAGHIERDVEGSSERVPVIHVVVRHLERLDRGGALRKQSRNFH